jgi:hypothetical protein
MVASGSNANRWPNIQWRAGPQVGPYFSASSYWKPPHREPFIVTHSWLPRLMTTTVSLGYCSIIVKKSTKISVDQSQRSACHSERSWALVLESATTPLKRHQWNNSANHVFSCSYLVLCHVLHLDAEDPTQFQHSLLHVSAKMLCHRWPHRHFSRWAYQTSK